MRTHVIAGAVLAGFCFTSVPATAATIFVSPIGSDAGACGSPAAPCKTLQRGVDRVDNGGTVLLTEPGNYGPAEIDDKSLSIRGVLGAGVFSPGGTPCLTINGLGGDDTISLSNFICDMDGAQADGILVNGAHKLRLDNTTVRGATGAKCGVRAKPSSGTFELMINNSTLSENGTTGTNNGGGICVLPTGTGQGSGVIRNSILQNNRHGGVFVAGGSTGSSFLIDGVDASNNAGGLFSVGANSKLCIRNSTITGNTFQGLGGTGMRLDGGGNTNWNNITDGNFSGGTCP